jgi:hypothetical protein
VADPGEDRFLAFRHQHMGDALAVEKSAAYLDFSLVVVRG